MSIFVCAQVIWPWGSALPAAKRHLWTQTPNQGHTLEEQGESGSVCHPVLREGALQQVPHSESVCAQEVGGTRLDRANPSWAAGKRGKPGGLLLGKMTVGWDFYRVKHTGSRQGEEC